MIYEIRTYGLTTWSTPEVEKRFEEGYQYRKKYSELAAFFHSEIGPLNEIIHIWPYKDLAERARVRAEAAKDPNWPPKIGEFIRYMHSEILIPFPCSPELTPGKYGPFYELRIYTLKSGTLGAAQKAWEKALPARQQLSPCHLVGSVDIGEANRMIHLWSHHTMDERTEIRAKAYATGIWGPEGMVERIATQENKIVMPSRFSPMQ